MPQYSRGHWYSVKEDYTYEVSRAINENLSSEKGDGYPTSRERNESYAAFYGVDYAPPGYEFTGPAIADDK